MTRRDRIRLLIDTYLDVCDLPAPVGEGHTPGKPGYRHLVRAGLWSEGSYAELERCLDQLQERGYVKIHRHLFAHMRGNKHRQGVIDRGLDVLEKWMPRTVYVPDDLLERAGEPRSEAKAGSRRRAA